MTALRPLRQVTALALLLVLSACGDGSVADVKQWMDEVRRQTPMTVDKLPEPKRFTPFAYTGRDGPDPFSPAKLSVALAKSQNNSGIRPDLDRRKEPLENYPLDTIRMVGTLSKPGLTYALLQVENTVFQVKVGNHIGQNFGLITRITEAEVELKEIVRDAAGEWVERTAKLELQENK